MNVADPIACYTFFADGIQRPVFEDAIGQYVLDGEEIIRGVWFIPPEADVPLVIDTEPPP